MADALDYENSVNDAIAQTAASAGMDPAHWRAIARSRAHGHHLKLDPEVGSNVLAGPSVIGPAAVSDIVRAIVLAEREAAAPADLMHLRGVMLEGRWVCKLGRGRDAYVVDLLQEVADYLPYFRCRARVACPHQLAHLIATLLPAHQGRSGVRPLVLC